MEILTPQAPVHATGRQSSYRISNIDLLRGIVMIIMALDHTRDMLHAEAFTGDPLDLQTTTPILFLTRWITHFCAPVFVFLSGTSAFLQGFRKPKSELSALLVKRGLWLIFIEVTVITLGITFDIGYSNFILQVIWAIGISKVLLGIAIWLPFSVILFIGLLIVLGHNALDSWESGRTGAFPLWYSLLHRSGVFPLRNGHSLMVFYPFLPWTGTMLLGYCFGKFYRQQEDRRKQNQIITATGIGIILFFVVLRWLNVYGDPLPWSVQKNALYTFFSFVNTQKYPPSLLYLCMTLGPAITILGLSAGVPNKASRFFTVYGSVPFLYYVLHFYILHTIAAVLFLLRGHSWQEGVSGVPNIPFKFIMPGEGYSLFIVYCIWIAVVLALYPLCKRFSEYKRRHRKWWLSYL